MSRNSGLGLDRRRLAAGGAAVLTVLAAVVGGLAASVVGPRHVSLATAVAVSLLIGVGAVIIAGRRDAVATGNHSAGTACATAGELRDGCPASPDNEAGGLAGLPRGASGDGSGEAWPRQGAADVVRVLSGQGRGTWWEAAQEELPPAASMVHAPPPELASYLETAQVAQCPNCGELALDATHVGGGWALNCPACSHTWTWRIGTPWPDVTVRPRRRAVPGREPASSPSGNSRGPAGGPPAQRR